MYYITVKASPKAYQLSFDDIIAGRDISALFNSADTRNTITRKVSEINESLIAKTDFKAMCWLLSEFNEKYKHLEEVNDKQQLYHSFKIPKRNGKLRQIDAPNDELKAALDELKRIFEGAFYATYHTAAFAYIRGRSSVSCVQRHQANESKWFLKLDFHGFFPSTTQEFLTKMLMMQFPFCCLKEYAGFEEALNKALSLCFLNGGLPQGTPISPLLTNMMMIPIDHALSKYCREHSPGLLYTRYADDLYISSRLSFQWDPVCKDIEKILSDFGAPFRLNKEKTHYGSSAGRNWMLGLMLNKDNDVTIGYAKKKRFKAMLFSFVQDRIDPKKHEWDYNDVQHLQGMISYYKMVEKEKIEAIVEKYSKDFKIDIMEEIHNILSAS